MIALAMLNDWLEPKYLDHWQVQAKLQLLRLPATREFVYWKKSPNFWTFKLVLGMDHALVWRSAETTPDRFRHLGRYADLIVGARWKQGRVFVHSGYQFEIQPFELKFPYHLPVLWEYFPTIQGPTDLELLWAFTPPSGLHSSDCYEHRQKMQKTFLSIANK